MEVPTLWTGQLFTESLTGVEAAVKEKKHEAFCDIHPCTLEADHIFFPQYLKDINMFVFQ